MEEIANQVFVEQGYSGVVVSVLKLHHGLIMIDGPCRTEDRVAWQQKLVNLGSAVAQVLVLLDTHPDRLICMPSIEAPILAQENARDMIQNLPSANRPLDKLSGTDPEVYEATQSVRWSMPDLSYDRQLHLYWDEQPVIVTHQPGCHPAGSWVKYDAEKVIFVGDRVVVNQPPYLAWCSIDRWIEELTWLNSDFFKHYLIVSGRDGVIPQKSVHSMINFLLHTKEVLNAMLLMDSPEDRLYEEVPALLKNFRYGQEMKDPDRHRLIGEFKQLFRRQKLVKEKGEVNVGG